jgi:outer membrane protein OmpA-like peptidoglycan-associated protein
MSKKVKMYGSFVFAGALLFAAGTAVAQDFGKVETAPGFAYVRNTPVLGGSQSFNCAGGGGTIAYNMTSAFGMAMDLSSCKVFGLNNTYGVGSKLNGNEFTYVFGPRITLRKGRVQPFLLVNLGGERVALSCKNGNFGNACGSIVAAPPITGVAVTTPTVTVVKVINPNGTSAAKNAFALTAGGGLDIKLNKKFALRLFQAEYLYTRFGNDCPFAICSNNNSQNSFRLKSGIVMSWGGEGAPIAIAPPAPRMKPCAGGPSVPADQECPKRDFRLSIQASSSAICPGAVSTISSAGSPDGATTQWTVNGQPAGQAGTYEFGSTGHNAGSYTIGLKASADGYNDASAETAVTVRAYSPPTGSLSASPAEIFVGDKATLSANFTEGQCGGSPGQVAYSSSEGSVTGNVFDSSGVRFDPANTSEQQKTIAIMAKVADAGGSGSAQTAVVVKQKAVITAKRFPDIVFPKGSARINNCGKRVLLEELKSSLDSDPNGNVVFVGHTSESERALADLDLRRALNAAAVISAGAEICLGYSASNILLTGAGTADNGIDFQPHFCESSTGEITGNLVRQAEEEAKNRRVEVWFVPAGGVAPASAQNSRSAIELNVKALGCPK